MNMLTMPLIKELMYEFGRKVDDELYLESKGRISVDIIDDVGSEIGVDNLMEFLSEVHV